MKKNAVVYSGAKEKTAKETTKEKTEKLIKVDKKSLETLIAPFVKKISKLGDSLISVEKDDFNDFKPKGERDCITVSADAYEASSLVFDPESNKMMVVGNEYLAEFLVS